MTRLHAGIVGLGLAARAHVKGYETHPQAAVLAVCDVDRERAERFAAEHHIRRVYTRYEEMLADPEIDIVDIATPTHLHAVMTLEAALAGKHIHCEKPFCRNGAEGMVAIEAVRHSGVKLVVGETYVFLASHMRARELLEAGEIGRPLQVRQRHGAWLARPVGLEVYLPTDRHWRVDPVQSGGGAYPWIYDHAVHFFATAEYLMLDQRIDEVYALRSSNRALPQQRGAWHDPYTTAEADIPIISWTYDDPACSGVWMRAERLNGKYDYMRGFSTSICGQSGMIDVLGEGGHNLLWEGQQQHLLLHREGRDTVCLRFDEGGDDVWDSDISYYGQGHRNQVHHLIDCILADRLPRYSGVDGLHAVQCTLAAIRSAREARPVRVEEIHPDYAAYETT